jgi:NAD-dependent deacetylase
MNIVVFSGAGMSAESGIDTFRGSNGLWEQYRIEDVATPQAWRSNPKLVQHFYNMRRKQIMETQPNQAHYYVKELERLGEVTVITQNIDDLHERAGSLNVLHLHGNIRYSKSSGPNQEKEYFPIEGWELNMTDKCPAGYPLRPHVVWFGESVPMLDPAAEIIKNAAVLIVIGTSLQVYPAASLIYVAGKKCKKFIIDPSANEMNIPADFIAIPKNASSGMLECLELLQA